MKRKPRVQQEPEMHRTAPPRLHRGKKEHRFAALNRRAARTGHVLVPVEELERLPERLLPPEAGPPCSLCGAVDLEGYLAGYDRGFEHGRADALGLVPRTRRWPAAALAPVPHGVLRTNVLRLLDELRDRSIGDPDRLMVDVATGSIELCWGDVAVSFAGKRVLLDGKELPPGAWLGKLLAAISPPFSCVPAVFETQAA